MKPDRLRVRDHDHIHPDAEGAGCLILLLAGAVVVGGLLALASFWLTR
jgi:hypothetical protein